MYYLIYCKFFQKTILLVNWIRVFRNIVMKNLDRPWIFPFIFARFKFNELQGSCMHLILGTWYNSLTLNTTIDKSCQAKKKKDHIDCWKVVPMTLEQLCQQLLKNCVSDCWIIVPGTPGQSCPGLLQQSCARCYCSIMLAIVEESCQRLVKNCANDSRTINCVRECWTMKLVTSKTCACDHSIHNVTVEQRNVSTMDDYVSYCCKVVPTDRLTGF